MDQPNQPLELHIAGDRGWLIQGGKPCGEAISDMQLQRKDLIDGLSWTLGQVVDAMIGFAEEDLSQLHERALLQLGSHLFRETFGKLKYSLPKHVDLRIFGDEWINSLPWNLLANHGTFLCASGLSVAIGTTQPHGDICLPPSPYLLIIAPQPSGLGATQAGAHIEELCDVLGRHNPLFRIGQHISVVRTWDALVDACTHSTPELLYYYGHGSGGNGTSRLHFEDKVRPMGDLALLLEQMARPPLFAYINCCLGDAGGLLGAGNQLGRVVSAVLTNRTVALVDAARQQAVKLWSAMLLRGEPPQRAVAELQSRMDLRSFSCGDIRWITPVLHAGYAGWHADLARVEDHFSNDPFWHLKVDRVVQYSTVMAQCELMLREQRPRCRSFVWYGTAGQGVEIFHQRLHRELDDALPQASVHTVRLRWPDHLSKPDSSFRNMLCEAFDVASLNDIPARVRHETQGCGTKQTLIYLRHEPVAGSKLINPISLRGYILWLDAMVAPLLEDHQYLLVGISFVVENPAKFRAVAEKHRVRQHELEQSVFMLLNALEHLAEEDLETFVHTHNIKLPESCRDWVLQEILRRSGGHYEATIEELKNIRDLALARQLEPVDEGEEDELDY